MTGYEQAKTAGDNVMYGFAGNDEFFGGNGHDRIYGGPDDDTSHYSDDDTPKGIIVDLSNREPVFDKDKKIIGYSVEIEDDGFGTQDTLFDIENIVGSKHDDLIVGDDEDNVLAPLRGNDTLTGNGGKDTFILSPYGGTTPTLPAGDFGTKTITDFNPAEDKIQIDVKAYYDYYNHADFKPTYNVSNNTLNISVYSHHLATLENITQNQLADVLQQIEFTGEDEKLIQTFDNLIQKTQIKIVSKILTGTAGADTFDLNEPSFSGSALIKDYTAAQGDVIYIDPSAYGISDIDDVTFNSSTNELSVKDAVIANLENQSGFSVESSVVLTKSNFVGTDSNENIIGDDEANILVAGKGNYNLTGNGGQDTFVLSSGEKTITDFNPDEDRIQIDINDYYNASNNQASFDVSHSNDTLTISVSNQKITLNNISSSQVSDVLKEIEFIGEVNMTGRDNTVDILIGDDSGNYIYGNGGNDYMYGGLRGDALLGSRGNDVLLGGDGDDYIAGMEDSDILVGGAGADSFGFQYYDSVSGVDRILDFNPSEGDSIVISKSLYGISSLNDLKLTSAGELMRTNDSRVIVILENQSGFDINSHVSLS
ncbi:hypothetical protein [Dapis sp. BLCC M229]|uniref:hypothetical protein n=1 Tax=Dapis sp. BLCC M229 TaxID=3400188 RepID=UPI003CE76995